AGNSPPLTTDASGLLDSITAAAMQNPVGTAAIVAETCGSGGAMAGSLTQAVMMTAAQRVLAAAALELAPAAGKLIVISVVCWAEWETLDRIRKAGSL